MGPLRCDTHQVETRLRCAQCEEPICPRCIVRTAVGLRCRACAAPAEAHRSRRPRRRLPLVIGGAAALLAGVVGVLVVTRPFDAQPPVDAEPPAAEDVGETVTRTGDDAGLTGDTIEELRRAVGQAAATTAAGGTVAWITTPDGQLGLAAGEADAADGRDLTGTEAFHVGGVTKMVTATVALQLVEEGRLALDAPIAEVVPDEAAAFEHGEQITLRQLLAHRSGLPDFWDSEFHARLADAATVEDGVVAASCPEEAPVDPLAHAARNPSAFEPGTRGEYSSTNYVLVGAAIEAVTGKPLAAVYRERILEPLGLRDTWLTCATAPRAELARGYEPRPGRSPFAGVDADVLDVTDFEKPFVSGAGGLVSTGPDLAAFARALFSGELFDEEATLERMRDARPLAGSGPPHGLGVAVEPHVVSHSGDLPGYHTRLRYYPIEDTVVVAFGNQIPVGPHPPSPAVAMTSIESTLFGLD